MMTQDSMKPTYTMPALTVIDGSGFVYRAFHALPPLTTPDGVAVGAVVGFANMILRWQETHQPTHGVVVLDCGRSIFRQTIFPEYKAHRPETPPELSAQFPRIKELCVALNIQTIEKAGIEADDIIASITEHAVTQGWQVTVVTSDKDLCQISGPNVCIHDPLKQRTLDTAAITALWGVRPDQIPHIQALAGDSADGIPGIPGIGIKTATDWIQTFGSLENLIHNADTLKSPRKRDLVQQYAQQARLCYQLTVLQTTFWDPHWHLESWAWSPSVDQKTLREFTEKFHLKTLADRLKRRGILHGDPSSHDSGSMGEAKANTTAAKIHPSSVSSVAALRDPLLGPGLNTTLRSMEATLAPDSPERGPPPILDLPYSTQPPETIMASILHAGAVALIYDPEPDLMHAQISGVTAFWGGDCCAHIDAAMLEALWIDPSCIKIVYDAKNWMHHTLQDVGMHTTVYTMGDTAHSLEKTVPLDDIMLLSYVLYGTQHKQDLWRIFLNFGFSENDIAHGSPTYHAQAIYRIWEKSTHMLREKNLMYTYYGMDRPLIPVLAKMEALGIDIDRSGLEHLEKIWQSECNNLVENMMNLAGQSFNPGSPKQLGKVLFQDLGWPNGKKGKSGAYQTDSDVLTRFATKGYDLARLLLEWRQLSKLINTYVKGLLSHINPTTQRIHTTYSMVRTSTGRLSSLDPNLQNIPIRTDRGRMLRHQFRAPPGYGFLCLDYSQIELRLLAHMGPIQTLQRAFQDRQDIHNQTASQLFACPPAQVTPDMRRTAKGINFGILYGISAFGLAEHLGIDRTTAKSMISQYFQTYPEIAEYLERTKQHARDHGYVQTLWGRHCMIPSAQNPNAVIRAGAERQAINAPLQGTSADIIKRAMIACDRWICENPDYDVRLVLQIHDELVFQVHSDHQHLVRNALIPLMENMACLSVPLVVTASFGETLEQS